MSTKLNFKALSPLYVCSLFCLILGAGCQNTDPAPVLRSSTTSANSSTKSASEESSSSKQKSSSSTKSTKKPVEDKVVDEADPVDTTSPPALAALPEAKQTEIKGLFAGAWASACVNVENPQVAGQFYSFIETWTLLADGNIEIRYQDFDGASCTTPAPGFENYVASVGKPVGVKEIGAAHFYIEMNLSKELNQNGMLVDSTTKFLAMVKFETGSMSIDYAENTTATTLSANAMKLTKK